jgi:hypothetical protein
VRGLGDTEPATDDEREFVVAVFDKMIQAYKNANRPRMSNVIERARRLLGKNDIFCDRQAISFFGKRYEAEALEVVRQLRARDPEDYVICGSKRRFYRKRKN